MRTFHTRRARTGVGDNPVRERIRAAMGKSRRPVWILTTGAKGLESHQFKQAGGSEEDRSKYAKIPPVERRGSQLRCERD